MGSIVVRKHRNFTFFGLNNHYVLVKTVYNDFCIQFINVVRVMYLVAQLLICLPIFL